MAWSPESPVRGWDVVRVMLDCHVFKGSACQSHLGKGKERGSAVGWSSEKGNVSSVGLN